MKKYLILFLMIPFILLVGCQTKTQTKNSNIISRMMQKLK